MDDGEIGGMLLYEGVEKHIMTCSSLLLILPAIPTQCLAETHAGEGGMSLPAAGGQCEAIRS